MTDDLAVQGEQGAYVPCEEEAAPLDAEEEGAISGMGAGFVAIDAEAATLPALEDAAIVGSGVGFVPKPCEEELPCGPGFPYGPPLAAVWQNLTPGTTSPLNCTAGTVVAGGPGGVPVPPGFVSPGNYSYRYVEPGPRPPAGFLIVLHPILRFLGWPPTVGNPGEIIYEFRKNGVVLSLVAAHLIPDNSGFVFAIADPIWVPETLCIETGDELSIWASGDLSNLVSVDQGLISLQTYVPPP